MDSMQVEALLTPVSPDEPCGRDLEYDQAFMALEQSARGKPEQQFGDTVVPAEEPDWAAVRRGAEELFSRTKDLRVAVLLARSLLKSDHAAGLAAGLVLVRELVGRYWDGVYPLLDADDGNDPTMRLNVLAQLADGETFLRDLRGMYIVPPGRHGKLTAKDILVHLGKFAATSGEPALSQSEIEGVLRAAGADNRAPFQALQEGLHALTGLRAVLVEKVDAERVPDLRPLEDALGAVARFCDNALGGSAAGSADAEQADAATAGTEGAAAPRKAAGELRTREDAQRLLDKVCEFIERTEPSSPAPLLIRRAQRLLNMTFLEIIQDLAADGASQVRTVTGVDKQ
jgi:type VI secretion system protein ImpA